MIKNNGKYIVEHHIKYKEIHGYDETVFITQSEHIKLHRRLRKEGKCNIPSNMLKKIVQNAHRRTDKYKQYHKEYRKSDRNKEIQKEYMQKYQETNKEKLKEYQKNYRESHKEKIQQYHKKYYQENKIEQLGDF